MEATLNWQWTGGQSVAGIGGLRVSIDDNYLVDRARAGDSAAFEQLFEQFHGPILNYLHRMVHDRAVAEDLTQDAFIKAYKALPKTREDLSFKAWLYRIATNTAISHMRRGKIIQWLPIVGDRESQGESVAGVVTRQTDISTALDQLPQHYASVLLLRHYQGLSLAETAAALEITENAAKLRLFRARKAFAKVYDVDPGEPVEGDQP
jgi:RNA polymerase sigma-70 factor (ECF subfamily)